ncbi:hypothetical protein CARUB_v10024426mg [Capsella rubella]|uniref:Uncharacterized protein n=1 Tax=Capsella rubella TaxID=81985 RepID=R0HVV3_9BRAS|nr:hypothetical protein CARUB_v10024426mg [Capsella rubella]EOA28234.1 hypothetical protein CARUB_v10024426mg [Capsella rubella]
MRVMVSALTQVIGNQQSNSHDNMGSTDSHPCVYNPQDPIQQVAPTHQDEGIHIHAHVVYVIAVFLLLMKLCSSIWNFFWQISYQK